METETDQDEDCHYGQEDDEDGNEWDEEEEDEEEEPEGECYWDDEADTRAAGDVLRDIARWYREPKEVPGAFRWTCQPEWEEDMVVPLYRKHGWPGDDLMAMPFSRI